jgi:hypothetical protein
MSGADLAVGRSAPSLTTVQERLATMRRVNRKTAAWCSGLLIVVQMVTGPVAHSMPDFTDAGACQHAAAHGTPAMDGDCGDCPPAPDQSPAGSQHDRAGTHDHGKCPCPCGHTPALGTTTLAAPKPAPPAEVANEPKGPAFSAPLFDFLRPPN